MICPNNINAIMESLKSHYENGKRTNNLYFHTEPDFTPAILVSERVYGSDQHTLASHEQKNDQEEECIK